MATATQRERGLGMYTGRTGWGFAKRAPRWPLWWAFQSERGLRRRLLGSGQKNGSRAGTGEWASFAQKRRALPDCFRSRSPNCLQQMHWWTISTDLTLFAYHFLCYRITASASLQFLLLLKCTYVHSNFVTKKIILNSLQNYFIFLKESVVM